MINFEFISPTKIYFGAEEEKKIDEIILAYNKKRVLIVCGASSVIQSGLLDYVKNKLEYAKIEVHVISGVRANPSISFARAGIYYVKEHEVDLILAIGGGSVIDTAKAIAVGALYEEDITEFLINKKEITKAIPVAAILTIAAAGSELSSSCVLTDDLNKHKFSFNSDMVKPIFAILDPLLTYSVPKKQIAYGIVDIFAHSFERYFSSSMGDVFGDDFALLVMRKTLECGKKCLLNVEDYDARGNLMLLSSYSHNGFTNLGKKALYPIHGMEHFLSGYDVNIAHGAGLAILIIAWMERYYKKDLNKFANFADKVLNINFYSKEENVIIAIRTLKDYFKEIGAPTSLKEVGIHKEDIPLIAKKMTKNGTRVVGHGSLTPLDYEEVTALLEAAL